MFFFSVFEVFRFGPVFIFCHCISIKFDNFFHAYLDIRFEKARNSCMHVFQKFYNITYIYINHFRIFVVSVDRALSFC